MMSDTMKYRLRGAIAIASLVFVLEGSGFLSAALMRQIFPLNLGVRLPDRPLLAVSLFVMMELSVFVFLILLCFGDWVVWLVLMKRLYGRSEMSAYLGFELEPQSKMKKIFKRVFNLIY